ncbi:MAG: tRNA lysidine(34) synthetase TilS [Candidatus Saccharimonadales bacterium]
MKVMLPSGKWVVAVSGGVDSVVLLDLIAHMIKDQSSTISAIVAHFDHGIRPESADDALFVKELAARYGLAFFTERVELGAGASEAAARKARYDFLRRVQKTENADGIITAHHQDDLLETMILNLQRGTSSKGLSSLQSRKGLLRPLLLYTKDEIRAYALKRNLSWRDDSTNTDIRYARNRVRYEVLAKFSDAHKAQLLQKSEKASKLNAKIADLVKAYLQTQPSETTLDRQQFVALPDVVAREVLAQWMRSYTDVEISRKMIERLAEAIRSGRNNSLADVARGWTLYIGREQVSLKMG